MGLRQQYLPFLTNDTVACPQAPNYGEVTDAGLLGTVSHMTVVATDKGATIKIAINDVRKTVFCYTR